MLARKQKGQLKQIKIPGINHTINHSMFQSKDVKLIIYIIAVMDFSTTKAVMSSFFRFSIDQVHVHCVYVSFSYVHGWWVWSITEDRFSDNLNYNNDEVKSTWWNSKNEQDVINQICCGGHIKDKRQITTTFFANRKINNIGKLQLQIELLSLRTVKLHCWYFHFFFA